MRREYDFSKAVPFQEWRRARQKRRPVESIQDPDEDVAPLTKAQMRELDRRIKDSRDRTRYLLVSALTRRFVLYYNVSDDCYGQNDPRYATLFKRRAAAEAICQQLGDRVRVVRCRVNNRGQLVVASLPKLRYTWLSRRSKGAV